MPDDKDKSPRSKLKRRRLRRLGWTCAALLVLGYAVNGPIARWGVSYGINKALESQGMSGSSQVEGTLGKGFTITNLHYTGDQGIQSLQAGKLTLDYRISELLDQKIRGISLENASATIDIAKFPPSEDKSDDPHAPLRDTLSKIRNWVEQPDIGINDLKVDLLNKGNLLARFQLNQLSHEAKSSEFKLNGFVATDGTGSNTPEQFINLTWGKHSASFDRLEVLPEIKLSSVMADWAASPSFSGKLTFYSSELDVEASDIFVARLIRGKVDTAQIQKHLGIALPIEGTLSQLDITLGNWLGTPIPYWQINATASADYLHYAGHEAEQVRIQMEQKEQAYRIDLESSLDDTKFSAKIDGKWHSPESKEWWRYTSLDYFIKTSQLRRLVDHWYKIPKGISVENSTIEARGSSTLTGGVINSSKLHAFIKGAKANGKDIPAINLQADYHVKGNISASLSSLGHFQAEAGYNLNTRNYTGSFSIDEKNPDWINALCEIFGVEVTAQAPLKLTWTGKGNIDIQKPQEGTLKVDDLHVSLPGMPDISATTNLVYSWPDSIKVETLKAKEGDWTGTAELDWDGKVITVKRLMLQQKDEQIADITGTVPFRSETNSLKKFLGQKEPWNLHADTKKVSIAKLRQWFDIDTLEGISGSMEMDFKLAGSPRKPTLNSKLRANDVAGFDDEYLSPLGISVNFKSVEDQLKIQALITENEEQRVHLNGSFPFDLESWIDNENLLEDILKEFPIEAKLAVERMPLTRFKKLVPKIEKLDGFISGEAAIGGTINNPKFKADIHAEIPVLKIGLEEFRDARNLKLDATLTDEMTADIELTTQINGGDFKVTGTTDLNDFKNPSFDVNLHTKYALVHRSDLVSVRANTGLNLKGSLKDATISGRIGLVESLIYKDIELIPIGVPSSAVAEVKLPSIDPEKADNGLPVPDPFENWKLDLTILTEDPILTRGNIASGFIRGSLKVGGTLKNPEPDGSLFIHNVKAKLPFSLLEIKKGTATFTPKNGLIPTLDIRGQSSVGNHDVNVFIYGSADSPKTAFTSYPPLPESEIMALLATGSTTSGLANQEVATFKAFQIFLIKMRQKAEAPGGNKLFASLLRGVENLNLNVAEKDAFTGREYNSATIELNPSWHLTAQIDNEQQTRGLIIYVIRFR